MTPADSEPASFCSFCAQLRCAPRSNPEQQRQAKGETVSHAEFIALLRAKPAIGNSLNGLRTNRHSRPFGHVA
jgi:hypothetical protein